MNDGVRLELPDHRVSSVGLCEVHYEDLDLLTGVLVPDLRPRAERLDWDQALNTPLVVVLAADEIVADRDAVAEIGQVQSRRPPKIAIPPQTENAHRQFPVIVDVSGGSRAPQQT